MQWFYILFLCIGTLQADQESRKDLSSLEQEIDILEGDIHRLRMKALSAELKGNEYMHTQWGQYVDQIEKSESYDLDILKMEKRLEQLEKKQRELLIEYKVQQGTSNEQ